jgi:hypothetical protein
MAESATARTRLVRTSHFFAHEAALLLLGIATSLALVVRTGKFVLVAGEVTAGTFALLCAAILLKATSPLHVKTRLALAAGFVLWFYFAIVRIVPQLALPLQDRLLHDLDLTCFGVTPAVICAAIAVPSLSDVLSLCYLSFHAYLVVAFMHALSQPAWFAVRCLRPILIGYAVGFVFYMSLPAVGPALAFPELFSAPLQGGLPFRFNTAVVNSGSSVYDVFPSLHVFIACLLLHHDWRYCRNRFWIMSGPACGLVLSTVYLRFHYGIDLIAGFGLFLLFVATSWKLHRRGSSLLVNWLDGMLDLEIPHHDVPIES